MTSPCTEIDIKCPNCGQQFKAWHRASINLNLDSFDQAYIDKISSAVCPSCQWKVALPMLVVRDDGVWEFREGKPPRDSE